MWFYKTTQEDKHPNWYINKFCNDGIGDEFHYLFTCKNTDINLLRCKYILPYFYNNPNVYKIKGILFIYKPNMNTPVIDLT
jgi:hypothetical protein